MKRFLLCAALAVFGLNIQAQEDKKPVIETKSVEVEKANGETKVTITTRKNDEVTKEVLTGADAEKWIEENDPEYAKTNASRSVGTSSNSSSNANSNSNSGKNSTTDVTVSISKPDVTEIKKEIIVVQEQMNEELEKVAKKLSEINVDSVLKDFGIEVYNTDESYHFEMKTSGDDKKSVIVMKSMTKDETEEVNVDVEVEVENGETRKQVSVVKHAYMLEDNAELNSNLKLDQLNIYPNPSDGVLKVDFVSKSTDNITLEFSSATGDLVSIMETSGKGAKNIVFDLNDLPAGVYYLTIKQSGKALHKKLMIQ